MSKRHIEEIIQVYIFTHTKKDSPPQLSPQPDDVHGSANTRQWMRNNSEFIKCIHILL